MMKSLVLTLFLGVSLIAAGAASAQDRASLSEMPAGATAAITQAPPAQVYNSSVGPINMRPGAYVGRNSRVAQAQGSATQAGRRSLPDAYNRPAQTSATAYNQSIVNARQSRIQRQNSLIPSPFPPGWGE